MEFGLSKCAQAIFKRSKLGNPDHVPPDEETMNKKLNQEKGYTYLDVDEFSGNQQAIMKEKLKKELLRRTPLTFKTELNSKNQITAINIPAIPIFTFGFNIIDWNLSEVRGYQ